MKKLYKVFISSTSQDLGDARQHVSQALLRCDCFPAGMELFPAADEEQFSYIKEVIDESDYYVIISAGRYGSIEPRSGLSFTELEYDWAVQKKKPIIRLLHRDPLNQLRGEYIEQTDGGKQKLLAFREKLQSSRLVRLWSDAQELGAEVVYGIEDAKRRSPSQGWIRATKSTESMSELKASIVMMGNALQRSIDELIDNLPYPVLRLDTSGEINYLNSSAKNLIGPIGQNILNIADIFVEENFSFSEIIKELVKGKIKKLRTRISGSENKYVELLLLNNSENDNSILTSIYDITDLMEMQSNQLEFARMASFGQLAGGVAHDFNNMLQAIMGNVDLLMLNHPPSDPSYRYIAQVRQNCNRAAALVRHLLAFSRKQTLRPQVLHMDDVLSDLSMTVDRLVGETVKLEVDIASDVWPVKADLTQLENVLINLAVNARDAMPDGGQLAMSTRNVTREECATFTFNGLEAADYVLLSVKDTGTGIAPEIMDKIFEPFFTTKDVGKGTGLGLATVYGTIKQTGGYVYPKSAVGEGTTFQIFLPRYSGEETAIVAEAQNAPAEDLAGTANVLLVEDEEAVRMVNATLLKSGGFTVYEAGHGLEALEVLEERGDNIELIISNVVMPEMDGPNLLQRVKKLYPGMKFIFVSGYAEDAFAKNLPDDQPFTFLAKPFSMRDFAETVKRVLAS